MDLNVTLSNYNQHMDPHHNGTQYNGTQYNGLNLLITTVKKIA
jgi:hypothetical protein